MDREKLKEALEHLEHVLGNRAVNQPTHHLDIRLVGHGLSITILEVDELRDLLRRAIAHNH